MNFNIPPDLKFAFETQVNELAAEILKRQTEYEEAQIKQLITQLILSGDIRRYIFVGRNGRSAICYLPFERANELEAENEALRKELAELRTQLSVMFI